MNIPESLQPAIDQLDFINNEFSRPVEDVVPSSLCSQTRHVIHNLLHYYIKLHALNYTNSTDIVQMLETCAQKNKQFSFIDSAVLLCNPVSPENEHKMYCTDMHQAGACLKLANDIKTIILSSFE